MAEHWAYKAPQLMHSLEILLIQITDNGEEMLSNFRFANYWYLNRLFYMAARMSSCNSIPGGTEYVQAVNKAIASLYELVFPNDDMSFDDLQRMCLQYRSIAEDEISLGNDESIVKRYLTRAVECAEKSTSVKEHELTHPLVYGWKVYDTPSDCKQIVRLLQSELMWECFDEYRNKEWFIDLCHRLEKI